MRNYIKRKLIFGVILIAIMIILTVIGCIISVNMENDKIGIEYIQTVDDDITIVDNLVNQLENRDASIFEETYNRLHK